MLLFHKPLYCKVKMDSRSQKEREEEGAEQSEVPPTSSSLGHSISCIPGLYSTSTVYSVIFHKTIIRLRFSVSCILSQFPGLSIPWNWLIEKIDWKIEKYFHLLFT